MEKNMDLKKDVKYVKTVGPNRVKLLNKLNIYTVLTITVSCQRSMRRQ